jgi:hypothetical protein
LYPAKIIPTISTNLMSPDPKTLGSKASVKTSTSKKSVAPAAARKLQPAR